jgi:paraquat-inducible protein B
MKNLEDAVVHAVDRFPEVADQIVLMLGRLSRILEEFESKHLPDRAAVTLGMIDDALRDVRTTLHAVDVGKLSLQGQKTLANLDSTTTQVSKLIDRVEGEKGLMRSAERASNAVGDVAKNVTGLGGELEETLRGVQEAAAAVQRLGDALDRDGDMLLKGRSKPHQ